MKQHNLEKISNDYFFGVCYEYYKRQMQIWILLKHKYLRTSSVGIEDRRFLYQDLVGGSGATTLSVEAESQSKDKKEP